MNPKRERLEQLAHSMKSLLGRSDARGSFTPDDEKRFAEMTDEAEALRVELRAEAKTTAAENAERERFNAGLLSSFGGLGSAPDPTKGAWGDAVVKAAGLDSGFGVKSLIPTGSVVVPALLPGITGIADRARNVLSLVPIETLQATDQYSYLRETVRTHNAEAVPVGDEKPVSVYSLEKVDDRVRTITTLSEAIPRQWLADAVLLRDYVQNSLRAAVELELERQLILGDGSGEDLSGLADNSPQPQSFSTDIITTARKAITLLESVDIAPGAFVLSPGDWETVELSAETGSGAFMFDNAPVDRAARKLWGLPVAVSSALTDGTGYLADFTGSTRLWQREAVVVDWSEAVYDTVATATDFQRNLVRFRAEGRFGFAVVRPLGVVEMDTAA